jgi:hypothetical protein
MTNKNNCFKANLIGVVLGLLCVFVITLTAPLIVIFQNRFALLGEGNFVEGWNLKNIILFTLAFLIIGYYLFSYLFSQLTLQIDNYGVKQKLIGSNLEIDWNSIIAVVLSKYGELLFYSKDSLIRVNPLSLNNKEKALEFIIKKVPEKFCNLFNNKNARKKKGQNTANNSCKL